MPAPNWAICCGSCCTPRRAAGRPRPPRWTRRCGTACGSRPGVPLTVVAVLPWDTTDTDAAPLPSLPGLLAACALPAGAGLPDAGGAALRRRGRGRPPRRARHRVRRRHRRRGGRPHSPAAPAPALAALVRLRSPDPLTPAQRWRSICCAPRGRARHRQPRAGRRSADGRTSGTPRVRRGGRRVGRRRNRHRHPGVDRAARPPGGKPWTRPARPAPSRASAPSPSGTPSARTAC